MTTKLGSFGAYGLHLMQFPSGRFGFVGTIPVAMCIEKKNSLGLPHLDVPSFETEKEALQYFESKKPLFDIN